MGKPASFASNESFCVPLELHKLHVSPFASMQVLRRRQVLPEEQHDPVPDRLRGRTDEGRLRAAGPLTTLRPRRSQEGKELREDLKGTCNQTQEALVSSPSPCPHYIVYTKSPHKGRCTVQISHRDVFGKWENVRRRTKTVVRFY